MPLKTKVAAPGSLNFEGLGATPAREGSASMCVCTQPVRTGIGAVCVEHGRPKWPNMIFNHTQTHTLIKQRQQKKAPYTLA